MTGRSFGQQWDDKATTAQVKTRLVTERAGNAISTGVGTQFGIVHLTGTVQTPDQKAEAERIASRVAGVKGVRNDIVVVPRHSATAKAPGESGQPAASPAPAGPVASPAPAAPMTLSGEVTAVDRASGDVTVKTSSGDVMLRLPASTAQGLEQGQHLSINAGGRQ